ncbi:MAG TPA: HepT-like ribonuclease domain-containing protein [Candidatus Paceibacterota bacterium]
MDTLRAYYEELKPWISFPSGEILANNEKIRAIERLFQLLVDEAVDINTLIIADSTQESPENYRSTFYGLSELGLLDHTFADTISFSAKLRNQIVHDYDKVQRSVMIEDIKKFILLYEKYIATLIEKFVA